MINLVALAGSLAITTPISYFLLRNKEKQMIKGNIEVMVRELKLYNSLEQQPKIGLIVEGTVIKIELNIRGICDYSKIEDNLNFIKDLFGAVTIESENNRGIVDIKLYVDELQDMDYIKHVVPNTTLLCGYNHKGFLTADMLKAPHILISGLSGNGKSRMVNYILNNLIDVDIVVLNGFERDYKGFKLIYGNKDIEDYLKAILEDKSIRKRPLYIVMEEMQGLGSNKKIAELCKELLSAGRHYNILCIGIIQVATKQSCSWKDLFNCRICFKQNENSAYSVCLGVSVDKELKEREFYLYSEEGLKKGRTFNNNY